MGCGQSKVEDLPLVTLCRERKELIKAASEHRYALASAHISYFRSLRDVGNALSKFVEEELVLGVTSPLDTPILTLPLHGRKSKKGKPSKSCQDGNEETLGSSSSTLISHIHQAAEDTAMEDDEIDSHVHMSSGSDTELDSSSGHIHFPDSPEQEEVQIPPYYSSYIAPPSYWAPPGASNNAYYMKSSVKPTTVYEDPRGFFRHAQCPDNYSPYVNGGFFELPPNNYSDAEKLSSHDLPPAPPSPKASAWDFFNPFNTYDSAYEGYYMRTRSAYGSSTSSPDSKEVREREGIPDLEDEMETGVIKEACKGKKLSGESNKSSEEGTLKDGALHYGGSSSKAVPLPSIERGSRAAPSHYGGGSSKGGASHHRRTSREVPSNKRDGVDLDRGKERESSVDGTFSEGLEGELVAKTGLVSEVGGSSIQDVVLPKRSNFTICDGGVRNLHEVVKEIRDEFETASAQGNEVSILLEMGKFPHQPRGTLLKVIISRILYKVAPFRSSSHFPPRRSLLFYRTMQMENALHENAGNDSNMKPSNISSILESLYLWEKKLYKEVKNEEKLRILYEKKCKKLRVLDERGAESDKIDAFRASIRKLLTKIDVSIRTIGSISSRIHKLRDEELQPQINEFVCGLIRMWKSMLQWHDKQFQAVAESKTRTLGANMAFPRDPTSRAAAELEMQLLNWRARFTDWVDSQRSYSKSLNGWLLRCLLHESEETADGVAPFSPGRVGAPPVFVACNDWCEAAERIPENAVADAMRNFALSLRELWERRDAERRQRAKAEFLSEDFVKRLETGRNAGAAAAEEGDDDYEVDGGRMRVEEERNRHKEALKSVHSAASSSIESGLIPIFEALRKFSSEVSEAHEKVRVQG